eukprot:gene37437-29447_t
MELLVIPAAFIVLAYFLRSVRLLLLSLVALVACIAGCFSVVLALSYPMPVCRDVPPVLLSVCVALSFDYSLFLLSRFAEGAGRGLAANVDHVIRTTGKTVTVSGTLIAVAFCSSLLIHEQNLQHAGIAAGVSMVVIVSVHLTLTPACLLAFGPALRHTAPRGGCSAHGVWRHTDPRGGCSAHGVWRHTDPRGGCSAHGVWLRMARRVERRPVAAAIAVVVVSLPVLVMTPRLRVSADMYM